ncbi:hypothetical protein EIP91_005121 [Steccherinum ochraceum]|uniref:Uncharacterized protein n=1 Tax=Steccherinum ochraceum TaxID=92696 RepID=A0A4V6N736_9APHY|nr:hypothetical protein EIP91_005121 [Steccherinum ochraceum]
MSYLGRKKRKSQDQRWVLLSNTSHSLWKSSIWLWLTIVDPTSPDLNGSTRLSQSPRYGDAYSLQVLYHLQSIRPAAFEVYYHIAIYPCSAGSQNPLSLHSMAQPIPVDPDDKFIGLLDDDLPEFPQKPYYIPLPPFPVRGFRKPVFTIARCWITEPDNYVWITFHLRWGTQPRDFNLDYCMPIPPKDIFHIRIVIDGEEKLLLPMDGRSYGFPLMKAWKLCIGNMDMFYLQEIPESPEESGREGRSRLRERPTHRLRVPGMPW